MLSLAQPEKGDTEFLITCTFLVMWQVEYTKWDAVVTVLDPSSMDSSTLDTKSMNITTTMALSSLEPSTLDPHSLNSSTLDYNILTSDTKQTTVEDDNKAGTNTD